MTGLSRRQVLVGAAAVAVAPAVAVESGFSWSGFSGSFSTPASWTPEAPATWRGWYVLDYPICTEEEMKAIGVVSKDFIEKLRRGEIEVPDIVEDEHEKEAIDFQADRA